MSRANLRWIGFVITPVLLAAACGGDSPTPDAPEDVDAPGSGASQESSKFSSSLSLTWQTDFSKASVSPDELLQAQTKDGIPAIDEPRFVGVSEASFLSDKEPVIFFQLGDDARAYPIQVLIWHEIVNDVVDGTPVLITFCPLCNTAIAFDRRLNGVVFDFGTTGFLRNSDLVMYDRQTESWWQQIGGDAIVGELTGAKLKLLPSSITSWADFRQAFPEGKVLSRETGFSRPYGQNPYVGYDDVNSSPFLFQGSPDGRLAAMERVATVELNGETAAYPFSRLIEQRVVADEVGGVEIVVFFKPGTVSPLDLSSIADSRDVGATGVFLPMVDGQTLTFSAEADAFIDKETGSRWDILGRAVAGALKGKTLEPVVSANHFWFSWAAFKPETRVWSP